MNALEYFYVGTVYEKRRGWSFRPLKFLVFGAEKNFFSGDVLMR